MVKFEFGSAAPEEARSFALEYLKLIFSFLGAVAWPIAAVIVVLIFREQLVTLVARVRQLSGPGGINATFDDELEKTREIAENSPVSTSDVGTATDEVAASLAQAFPEAAILQAYHAIEKRFRDISPEKNASNSALLSALTDFQIISRDTKELFDQIRRTRNAAVHSARPITTGEALEFQSLVKVFLDALTVAVPQIDAQRAQLSERLWRPRLIRA
ncbi:DUF4145 domain-containing protein [Rhizobium leguminosarum]|uniref:DUF4145 domain-containing protein n=1 Tax=Rhizobium leguminosarum TaxID=384 RepID=UPI00144100C3|nr:DUF4145 domain-containing protein [Rhizobium leguminosarum]